VALRHPSAADDLHGRLDTRGERGHGRALRIPERPPGRRHAHPGRALPSSRRLGSSSSRPRARRRRDVWSRRTRRSRRACSDPSCTRSERRCCEDVEPNRASPQTRPGLVAALACLGLLVLLGQVRAATTDLPRSTTDRADETSGSQKPRHERAPRSSLCPSLFGSVRFRDASLVAPGPGARLELPRLGGGLLRTRRLLGVDEPRPHGGCDLQPLGRAPFIIPVWRLEADRAARE
jgi:hypothetical protein